MISHILRLTGWEWYKLQRRWMPWILLGIMILVNQIGFWGTYVGYRAEAFGPSFHTSIGDATFALFQRRDIAGAKGA